MIRWFKDLFKKKAERKLEESAPTKKGPKPDDWLAASKYDLEYIPKERALKPPPFESEEIPEEDPVDLVEVIDLRGEQSNPPELVRGKKKWRTKNGKVVERRHSDITGITVHQTAARFGVGPAAIRASNGDEKMALARRSKGVACHVMAFADGFVAWPNPLDWYVWHGNGFNSDTLGIEIDGDFAGLADDPTTAFRKKDNPDRLTPELEAAAKRGIKLLVEEGRKQGMPIKYIYAHRQSSPTRRSDPGEEIWQKVVLDYAVKELGLKTRPDHIRLKGYTIPRQWDPDGPGDYWDDPKR